MTDDIPKSARALANKAERNGWMWHVTHTPVGEWLGKPVDHVCVRLKRDNAFMAAFWENGAFRCAVVTAPDAAKLNSRELAALVESSPTELGGLLDGLLAGRRAKAAS